MIEQSSSSFLKNIYIYERSSFRNREIPLEISSSFLKKPVLQFIAILKITLKKRNYKKYQNHLEISKSCIKVKVKVGYF